MRFLAWPVAQTKYGIRIAALAQDQGQEQGICGRLHGVQKHGAERKSSTRVVSRQRNHHRPLGARPWLQPRPRLSSDPRKTEVFARAIPLNRGGTRAEKDLASNLETANFNRSKETTMKE